MQIFRNININLYSMYFKKSLNLNNQYEYIRTMYYWNPKAVEIFERGTFRMSNFSDKWMRKGISDYFFSVPEEDNILNSPNLFDICYDNLKNTLYLTNTCELSEVLHRIIFEPERNVFEPFRWEKNCQIHMKQIFESYDSIQVLCTLLIYAQTQNICTPRGKYRLKNDFSYIKGYRKEVINQNFHLFLENAVEINMSQISIPSLMESYRDFFKRNNKNSIINALNKKSEITA